MNGFLENSAFFGVALSLCAYSLGVVVQKHVKCHLLNPLLVSAALIIALLVGAHIDYEVYNTGAKYLSYLLTPATVCLAVPLYEKLSLLRRDGAAVLTGVLAGVLTTLMSVLLLAMMLPFVAIMIPLFKMMSHWGLVNSWAAFVLPSISTPFMIMLFRQASRSFPNDIIEAARLDGLSEIGIFFRMFVPIMRSTYGAAMTVTFMNAWNSYLWPKIIFQNNASITMPMLVANLKSGYSVDYGMLMLGVLICTLPTAIIFLCLQKSFANGITGAVK